MSRSETCSQIMAQAVVAFVKTSDDLHGLKLPTIEMASWSAMRDSKGRQTLLRREGRAYLELALLSSLENELETDTKDPCNLLEAVERTVLASETICELMKHLDATSLPYGLALRVRDHSMTFYIVCGMMVRQMAVAWFNDWFRRVIGPLVIVTKTQYKLFHQKEREQSTVKPTSKSAPEVPNHIERCLDSYRFAILKNSVAQHVAVLDGTSSASRKLPTIPAKVPTILTNPKPFSAPNTSSSTSARTVIPVTTSAHLNDPAKQAVSKRGDNEATRPSSVPVKSPAVLKDSAKPNTSRTPNAVPGPSAPLPNLQVKPHAIFEHSVPPNIGQVSKGNLGAIPVLPVTIMERTPNSKDGNSRGIPKGAQIQGPSPRSNVLPPPSSFEAVTLWRSQIPPPAVIKSAHRVPPNASARSPLHQDLKNNINNIVDSAKEVRGDLNNTNISKNVPVLPASKDISSSLARIPAKEVRGDLNNMNISTNVPVLPAPKDISTSLPRIPIPSKTSLASSSDYSDEESSEAQSLGRLSVSAARRRRRQRTPSTNSASSSSSESCSSHYSSCDEGLGEVPAC